MSSKSSDSRAAPPISLGWAFRSPSRIVAFGLGSGLLRPAPGTWGTALGWLLWVVVVSRLPDAGIAAVLLLSFAYGCWACHRVGRELGRADDGAMVWEDRKSTRLNSSHVKIS